MKTLSSILLLAISCLIALPCCAQTAADSTLPSADSATGGKKILGIEVDGLSVSTDLLGFVSPVFGAKFTYYEVALQAHIRNRFMPVVEVGYGNADHTDGDNSIHYKTSAPYFRVGMDYNLFYKKQTPNYVYCGARIGYSSFSYDMSADPLTDPVWGGSVPFEYEGVSTSASWWEIVVGLRAQVLKHIHMGWSLRYKRTFSVKETANTSPWYIPGFGENESPNYSLCYNLIYYIPW